MGPKVWAAPAADGALPAVFPDTFEVRVLSTDTGPNLVAAIELVSPGNKDRPAQRTAFAIKCASEILRIMGAGDSLQLPPEQSLYAVAYQPLRRGQCDEIDVWRSALALGQALPTLPLGLRADLVIPVDFEATYAEACFRKRLTGS